MVRLVYYSSASENTHRLVTRLGVPAQRLPLRPADPEVRVDEPYVLVVPTYGAGNGLGAVPRPVIRFLNVPAHRELLLGVVATGNTNFGTAYGLAGDIVAARCGVPLLTRIELMGTPDDVVALREGLHQLWQRHCSPTQAPRPAPTTSTTTPSTPC